MRLRSFFCLAIVILRAAAAPSAHADLREDVLMLYGRSEETAAGYFSDRLQSLGVDLLYGSDGDRFGIRADSGDTLVSRNVIGFIQGYDADSRDEYVVIGAPLLCGGANGNASGLALALDLASRLSEERVLLRRSVLIAAFGGASVQNSGAWYFLNRSFGGKVISAVCLDMVGTASGGFYAYAASNPDLDNLLKSLNSQLQPIRPDVVAKEPVASCHRAFYEKEIPAVLFTTGRYPEYRTRRDTPDIIEYPDLARESDYVHNLCISLCNADNAPSFRHAVNDEGTVSYMDCDVKPAFLGSRDPSAFLRKWVYVYLKYPEGALRDGVQGKVLVEFTVDGKGDVRDVEVVRGPDGRLEDEAVRVVEASPRWKPGIRDGRKVAVRMSTYIEFKLERK